MPIMRLIAVVIAAFLMAGCSALQTTHTVTDDQFRLTTTVSRLAYRSGEAIDVTASLTYTGSEPHVVVRGVDYGLVTIWFKQLDGPLSMSPMSRLMCATDTVRLTRGVTVTFPAAKVAGYVGNVPSASFYQSWNADPLVHLPVGRWQVQSHLATCGPWPGSAGEHDLATPPLILTVAP